jgi:hypothetical protein
MATLATLIAFASSRGRLCSKFLRPFATFTALAWQNITLINPHLDANKPKGRMSFCQPIVNISAQCMQRNFPLYFFLRARNFCSTQATTDNDLDALCISTHCFLHSLLHSPAK